MEEIILNYVHKLPINIRSNIKQELIHEEDGEFILLIWFKTPLSNKNFTAIVKHFDKCVKDDVEHKIVIKMYNYNDDSNCLKYIFGGI